MPTLVARSGAPANASHSENELGRRLKLILLKRGWSLARLSRESGVSTSALSLMIRGQTEAPRIITVQKVCGALNLPPSIFLSSPSTIRLPLTVAGADFPSAEGVIMVPVVRFDLGNKALPTEETVAVPVSLLEGRIRLFATRVVGSGLTPWVVPGAMVIYDPDVLPGHGSPVVVACRNAPVATVHLLIAGRARYRNIDGSWLPTDDAELAGVIVKVQHDPPDPAILLHQLDH